MRDCGWCFRRSLVVAQAGTVDVGISGTQSIVLEKITERDTPHRSEAPHAMHVIELNVLAPTSGEACVFPGTNTTDCCHDEADKRKVSTVYM